MLVISKRERASHYDVTITIGCIITRSPISMCTYGILHHFLGPPAVGHYRFRINWINEQTFLPLSGNAVRFYCNTTRVNITEHCSGSKSRLKSKHKAHEDLKRLDRIHEVGSYRLYFCVNKRFTISQGKKQKSPIKTLGRQPTECFWKWQWTRKLFFFRNKDELMQLFAT